MHPGGRRKRDLGRKFTQFCYEVLSQTEKLCHKLCAFLIYFVPTWRFSYLAGSGFRPPPIPQGGKGEGRGEQHPPPKRACHMGVHTFFPPFMRCCEPFLLPLSYYHYYTITSSSFRLPCVISIVVKKGGVKRKTPTLSLVRSSIASVINFLKVFFCENEASMGNCRMCLLGPNDS